MPTYQDQEGQASQELVAKMELLQRIKADASPQTAGSSFQIVVVGCDHDLYGLRIATVREIVKVPRVTWLPCATAYIMGVISVRGDIQAVVKLKNLLALGETQITAQSRIILVESGELLAGLLVDEMLDILELPEQALLPLAEAGHPRQQDYLEGKIQWHDRMITLLHTEAILQAVVVNQI